METYRQVVNRDLKPRNILLDERKQAKVSDFGLARLAEISTSTTGKLAGTPHFMAPEQWTEQTTGPRADLYAAGLLLYYMLSGKVPFEGDNMLSLMYKHLHISLPPLTLIKGDLPEGAETLMRKATEKAADDRFQSADEFRNALEELGP